MILINTDDGFKRLETLASETDHNLNYKIPLTHERIDDAEKSLKDLNDKLDSMLHEQNKMIERMDQKTDALYGVLARISDDVSKTSDKVRNLELMVRIWF